MSQPIRVRTDHQKAIVKIFEALGYRHNRWTVWSDFVAMAACTLSLIDIAQREKRQLLYNEVAKKYDCKEMDMFAEMFDTLVAGLEADQDQDFLGELFMLLELSNDHNGQFFTPYSVCSMMAKISAGNLPAEIEQKGSVSVNDCACGAGALLIAFANEAKAIGINYQMHVKFVGQDIDFTAAMMCYIQLSLLGCPGYVIVGNTLTTPPTEPLTNQNVWYTPMYFHEVWRWRRAFKAARRVAKKQQTVIETEKIESEAPVPVVEKPGTGFIQLSLFN
jgi:hypothetical protein